MAKTTGKTTYTDNTLAADPPGGKRHSVALDGGDALPPEEHMARKRRATGMKTTTRKTTAARKAASARTSAAARKTASTRRATKTGAPRPAQAKTASKRAAKSSAVRRPAKKAVRGKTKR